MVHTKRERGGTVRRYFVGGKEITRDEAKQIEESNSQILRSGSIEQLLNMKAVIVEEG